MAGGEKMSERDKSRLDARILTLESNLCNLNARFERDRDKLFEQISYLQLDISNLRSDLDRINERYKDDTKVLHDYYKEAPFTKE